MFVRVLAVVLFGIAAHPALAQDKTVTVFVAASMTNVANDLNGIFTRNTGIKVTPSYAASSALAKQIEEGAPADVFISADIPWMNYVQERKLIKNNTRFDIAGNRLVLIAPKDSKIGEREDRHRLRSRQARRRRPHRHRRREVGAGRPLRARRRWRSSDRGRPPKASSP